MPDSVPGIWEAASGKAGKAGLSFQGCQAGGVAGQSKELTQRGPEEVQEGSPRFKQVGEGNSQLMFSGRVDTKARLGEGTDGNFKVKKCFRKETRLGREEEQG